MDDQRIRQWFLDPSQPQQRRFEILRACFVERQPMPELARRFGLSHGAVRNLVSQFRAQFRDGRLPPFSLRRRADDPSTPAVPLPLAPKLQRSRTATCSP
jgi:hypothetical protein